MRRAFLESLRALSVLAARVTRRCSTELRGRSSGKGEEFGEGSLSLETLLSLSVLMKYWHRSRPPKEKESARRRATEEGGEAGCRQRSRRRKAKLQAI